MNVKQLSVIVLIFALGLEYSEGIALSSVTSVAGAAIDIAGLATKIYKFIDKFESNASPDIGTDGITEILEELSDRIDASTTDIITEVVLQSKLELVDDAVINIHSSLIDLKNILQAKTHSEREQYKKLFISRFEEHGVIKHVRFLPQLLEYTIPGTAGKLVDLFADNTRCNMTAIYEFKYFYLKLLSGGISLEAVYMRYTTNIPFTRTSNDRAEHLDHINRIFESQEQGCLKKFTENANEDIKAASDASILWTNNKYRYTWKTCDVVFLEPYGTFQFLYLKYRKDYMFLDKSSKTKIAIFSNKNEDKPTSNILATGKEKFKSAIQGEKDDNAAKNVGIAVENHLREQGYSINALIVFFDGQELSSDKLLFHKDSPVLKDSIDGIKLKYCYESGFECTIDVLNWFGGTKNVYGQMKILAYASSNDKTDHETASSIQNKPNTFAFFVCVLIASIILH